MARIGIFSGTFDPVHTGHVAFCRAAIEAAGLQKVLLLPEQNPRGKRPRTSFAHRVAMLQLAIKDEPQLQVMKLTDRQFTVAHTLPQLQRQFAHDDLYLLMGSDTARSLVGGWWAGVETLLQAMQLVVGVRAPQTPFSVQQLIQGLQQQCPAAHVRTTVVESPHAHAASSAVRMAVSRQRQQPMLLPAVANYITTYNLYAGAPA